MTTMRRIADFILQLALIFWLGGIFFFAVVMAPATFQALDLIKDGDAFAPWIIAKGLFALHSLGLVCGGVYLIVSLVRYKQVLRMAHLLILVMMSLTLFSRLYITPRIEAARTVVFRMSDLAPTDPRRVEFDKWHRMSTITEGLVFFLGLGVVFLGTKQEEG